MKNCPSCRRFTRREALAGMGSWAALAALQREGRAQVISNNVTPRKTAKACIFINLVGAASHLDTFDVKDDTWNPPDANIQQAGKLALSTTLFPKLARLTGDLCVMRSVSSWEA